MELTLIGCSTLGKTNATGLAPVEIRLEPEQNLEDQQSPTCQRAPRSLPPWDHVWVEQFLLRSFILNRAQIILPDRPQIGAVLKDRFHSLGIGQVIEERQTDVRRRHVKRAAECQVEMVCKNAGPRE